MKEMEFKVIPNEQTPAVPKIAFSDGKLFVDHHREELEAFLEFASSRDNAVGLAANQCSLECERRNDIGLMEVSVERFDMRVFALRNMVTRKWSLVIDPHIRCFGIKDIKAEGCLTWKGRTIVAERSRFVEVDYFDMDGVRHQGEIYKGFEAQIWQHEVNHLNGVEEDVRDMFNELTPVEVGRNEPCPCGSGKKYKKCCWI